MDYKELMQKSMQEIEKNLSESAAIRKLADTVGFSPYHFQRIFHAYMGSTVMEYIKKRRLSLAGKELCETDASVMEVALKYGYGSHESFTRAFKSYHGVTPTECRKYHVYQSFESINISKEENSMRHAEEQFRQNKESIYRELNEFLVVTRQTVDSVCRITGQKAKTENFITISEELGGLAQRIEMLEQTVSFWPDDYDPEGFAAINQRFAFVKHFEDLAFQTNIIAFFAKIQVARTQGDYALPIAEACMGLANTAHRKSRCIIDILQDLNELVKVSIREQQENHCREIAIICTDTLKKLETFGGKILSQRNQLPDESLLATAAMLKRVTLPLSVKAEALTSSNGALQFVEKIPFLLEDCGFMLNIFAFNAKLDLARSPDCRPLAELSAEMLALPEQLAAARQSCEEHVAAMQQYASLIPQKSEFAVPAEKHLDDVRFQGYILLYAFLAELPNLEHTVAPESLRRLTALEPRLEVTCRPVEERAPAWLKETAGELSACAAALTQEADALGDIGGVLRCLAEEYAHLAEKCNSIAAVYE